MTGFGGALWILAVGGLLYLARVSSDWLSDRAQRASDAVAFPKPPEHFNCRCMLAGSEPDMTFTRNTIVVPGTRSMDYMWAAMAARQRTDVLPIEFDDLDHLTKML